MARLGLDIALRREVRRQLRAEIEAQFDAFRRRPRARSRQRAQAFPSSPGDRGRDHRCGRASWDSWIAPCRASLALCSQPSSRERRALPPGSRHPGRLCLRGAHDGQASDARRGVRPRLVRRDDDSTAARLLQPLRRGAARSICIRRPLMVRRTRERLSLCRGRLRHAAHVLQPTPRRARDWLFYAPYRRHRRCDHVFRRHGYLQLIRSRVAATGADLAPRRRDERQGNERRKLLGIAIAARVSGETISGRRMQDRSRCAPPEVLQKPSSLLSSSRRTRRGRTPRRAS